MRHMLLPLLVGACTTPEQPELRTYGVILPVCILFCEAAIETVDAKDGDASGGNISQTEKSNPAVSDNKSASITASR